MLLVFEVKRGLLRTRTLQGAREFGKVLAGVRRRHEEPAVVAMSSHLYVPEFAVLHLAATKNEDTLARLALRNVNRRRVTELNVLVQVKGHTSTTTSFTGGRVESKHKFHTLAAASHALEHARLSVRESESVTVLPQDDAVADAELLTVQGNGTATELAGFLAFCPGESVERKDVLSRAGEDERLRRVIGASLEPRVDERGARLRTGVRDPKPTCARVE